MTVDDIRKELFDLAEKKRRLAHARAALESCQAEDRELEGRVELLRAQLEKEQADVDRLEKGSLAAAALALFGKKEQRIEKERAELEAAKVKYQAALRQQEDCLWRMGKLRDEIWQFRDAPELYDRAYEKARQALGDDPEVLRLTELLGQLSAQRREISEAVNAGESCRSQIEVVYEHLDSAQSWGTWDMLGGGFIATMAKHDHLDEAEYEANHLQKCLSRFRSELADVKMGGEGGGFRVEGFMHFADYFFDGIFVDWMVLDHINRSRDSLDEVSDRVENIMDSLRTQGDLLDKKIENARAELDRAILGK
ncbi:MAG: hypothetical protein IJP23_05785 [Oscillospiraceae bacterium]|nr:hypothetical protein [Oscillospiraceae bacterium]